MCRPDHGGVGFSGVHMPGCASRHEAESSEAITCPTYVSYGEGDYAEATSKDFYDRLRVPKHFEMFKDADGSGGHCEGMGQARYYAGVFGFIAEHLDS
jgi:hypothetical protein